jgi:hypothetical protein
MDNKPFAMVVLVLVLLLALALWQFYSLAYGEGAALYRSAPSVAASPLR